MRRLIVVAALMPVAAVADIVSSNHQHHCAVDYRAMTAARGQNGFRRLDQMPRANEFLAVFRAVDRCPTPVVVRDDIGGTPRR